MIYLPDFMIYDINAEEYQSFWNGLKNHPIGQLYTDGVHVYKANWFVQLVQQIKGWFGFENRCDPHKVELTLAKIAYQGYLKGFNSQKLPVQLMSTAFQNLIHSNRTNQHSATLQNLIMSYYITHSDSFPVHVEQAYPFGRSLVEEGFYALFPQLDPQDSTFILQTVEQMTQEGHTLLAQDAFKENQFNVLLIKLI